LSSHDLIDEGTVLISPEGAKCVMVIYISGQLVEPMIDIKVGFRLRLVLRGRSVSRWTWDERFIERTVQPVTVTIVYFQVSIAVDAGSGSRNINGPGMLRSLGLSLVDAKLLMVLASG
jgi:hypothetical protein